MVRVQKTLQLESGDFRLQRQAEHNIVARERVIPEEIDRVLREWEDPDMLPHEQARGFYAVLASELRDRRNLTFVEYGTYCGTSTSILALVAREKGGRVVSVDTFDSRGTGRSGDTYEIATNNLKRRGLLDQVTLIRSQTQLFDPGRHGVETIDVFFHDASHDVYDVLFDFGNVARYFADDALVLIHDVAKGGGPTRPALVYLCKLFGVRGKIYLDANLGEFRLEGNPLRAGATGAGGVRRTAFLQPGARTRNAKDGC